MYEVTVWNKKSPQFGSNDFVRLNGTESFILPDEGNALLCMVNMTKNPDIHAITIEGPRGRMSWTQNPPPAVPDDYGQGQEGEHDGFCDDCDNDICDGRR